MFREQQGLNFALRYITQCSKLSPQGRFQKQFFLEPDRHRDDKRAEAFGGISQVGFQQPLEFEQWLVVENDMVDVIQLESCFVKAIFDGAAREAGIVLFAGKTFLLGGGNDAAVDQQYGSTVVIIGGYSQDAG